MTKRSAFTLVELLVVIAIMGVMMSILLPAIASCREAARRAQCGQRTSRLILAMHQYEAGQNYFPPAGWHDAPQVANRPEGVQQSWTLGLLPYLDQQNAFSQFKFNASIFAPENAPVRSLAFDVFRCPSDANVARLPTPGSSYAGCYHHVEAPIEEGSSGALVLNRPLRREEFPDGLAQTIFIGEKNSTADDLGWCSATRSTLRNTGHVLNTTFTDPTAAPPDELFVGGFGGVHLGGVWFALGDGHTRFLSDEIAADLLQNLGNRQDGALLSDDRL